MAALLCSQKAIIPPRRRPVGCGQPRQRLPLVHLPRIGEEDPGHAQVGVLPVGDQPEVLLDPHRAPATPAMACRPRRVTRGYARVQIRLQLLAGGPPSPVLPPSPECRAAPASRQQFLSQRSVGWVAITSATVQCSASPNPPRIDAFDAALHPGRPTAPTAPHHSRPVGMAATPHPPHLLQKPAPPRSISAGCRCSAGRGRTRCTTRRAGRRCRSGCRPPAGNSRPEPLQQVAAALLGLAVQQAVRRRIMDVLVPPRRARRSGTACACRAAWARGAPATAGRGAAAGRRLGGLVARASAPRRRGAAARRSRLPG